MSFFTIKIPLFDFYLQSVEKSLSQIYVNINGINVWTAFSVTFGYEVIIKVQHFVKDVLSNKFSEKYLKTC